MENITLVINGESRTLPLVSNVRELLTLLGVGEDHVAVEVNRKIVRRREWDQTRLSNMDRVEIVQFVGGG